MKKITTHLLYASIIIGVYFISAFSSLAQNNKVAYTAEEKNAIEAMKKDGASDVDIDKWIMQRNLISLKEKSIKLQSPPSSKPHSVNVNSCGEMGGENGWSGWVAATGDYATNGNVSTITWNNVNAPLAAPRFVLTNGGGTDGCTPGPAAGSPALPVVAPGFGNASIQIGQRTTTGMQGGCNQGCAERLTYTFTVTKADTNFIYAYAFVFDFRMNNGQPDHSALEVPFTEIYMLDASGDTVECTHQKYMGDTTGQTVPTPGLYDTRPACGFGDAAKYKSWTVVGVNLAKYLGQTLTVNILNVDCSQGGHYCHSYWDFMCPPVSSNITPYCQGQQTTLSGPVSDLVSNQYTYQWYVNKPKRWTIIPGATGVNYVVAPQVGDTFSVHVHQPSGCDFWIPYIPNPSSIIAAFKDTGNCGKMTFQDMSTVLPASATNTVVAWNWSFPGGTPASSTSQNPGTISYPPGTYTVTLITTSTAGCKDTIQHSFSVGGFPTPAFTPTSPCLGLTTTLIDGSVAPTGDPIASWNWYMPGGTPSSATSTALSPTHNVTTLYPTAGIHTVTLTVTSVAGCTKTIVQQVLVYNPPIANFIKPIKGCTPVYADYKDISDPVDGTIASWQWTFPGGSPATSTISTPTGIKYTAIGTYNVSLIVTTNFGCKDTITLPMVEVYPWPTAGFSVAPHIAPTVTPIFNFSDAWTNDVVKWAWDFGDGSPLDTSNTDPIHSYSATANNNDFYKYNICLRVQNQYGCWDTTCHPVELIPEFTFYIPNTFTPNGDHINEMFYGKCRGVKEYDIWLFDRWGNQIWDCHHEDKNTNWDSDATNPRQEGLSSFCQWDGVVVKGGMDMGGNSRQLAQEDVYVWKVKLLDIFDKRHSYIGHVNIVR